VLYNSTSCLAHAHLVQCVIQGIQHLYFGNSCNGTVEMKRNFS
jgi:hypothetical protein